MEVEILPWEFTMLGSSGPLKTIGSPCCGVCSKMGHSVLSNGMTARLLQLTVMLPTGQCLHFIKIFLLCVYFV